MKNNRLQPFPATFHHFRTFRVFDTAHLNSVKMHSWSLRWECIYLYIIIFKFSLFIYLTRLFWNVSVFAVYLPTLLLRRASGRDWGSSSFHIDEDIYPDWPRTGFEPTSTVLVYIQLPMWLKLKLLVSKLSSQPMWCLYDYWLWHHL
jgi:hypothetical protein